MSEGAQAVVLGLRIGGIVLMLLGLYEWLGGSIAGGYGHGTILAATGAIGALLLPIAIVRPWRRR